MRQLTKTLLGLLAVTGLRVGEAIRVDREDIDFDQGLLMVSEGKFGKSRELPLHPTTLKALRSYLRKRDRLHPATGKPALFVSTVGTRLIYCNVHWTFLKLVRFAGLKPRSAACRPRLHDLRHTFAVSTMLDAYRNGDDVQARLPLLSTYLGHVNPASTYWYTIATKTQLPVQQIVQWCGVARGKFYDWRKRYGKVNEHNGLVPRDHWVEEWERQSVIDYFDCHPLDGYRRLTFMMLDEDVVAVSPSTTYRVLSKAGRLDRWNPKPSKKGTGFVQPLRAHQHWHTDISYLNLGGTFYYLCSFLDGASRAVVHWEIRESMTEADVECILERAKERYPDARPRIISDNGPQYIAKDFKAFIRISGMTHVRTAPYYPQSNGKIERWHKTIKSDALRPASPTSLEEARRLMERFVEYYNGVRLHSAIGYIAPLDFMDGKATQIWSERDRKLEQARKLRRERRANKVPA